MNLIGKKCKHHLEDTEYTFTEESEDYLYFEWWDIEDNKIVKSYRSRENVEKWLKEGVWILVEDQPQGFIYPTYDLSLEGYNLSPKSLAFKKDHGLEIGDLVEFRDEDNWPTLGFVVELGSYHIDIQIAGSYEGDIYCASYDCIIKDSQLVKDLTKYFKCKQQHDWKKSS